MLRRLILGSISFGVPVKFVSSDVVADQWWFSGGNSLRGSWSPLEFGSKLLKKRKENVLRPQLPSKHVSGRRRQIKMTVFTKSLETRINCIVI